MPRIATPASIEAAPQAAQPLLQAVHKQLGVVPNMFRAIANSPAALEGYLGLNGALAKGTLEPQTRERIALAIAEVNGCDYCASAHTYLGKNLAKLSDDEIAANRDGASTDAKANAAVSFAVKLAQSRGHVSEADLKAVKDAGYTDAQVIEIVLHVALNTLTNYVNETVKTEIDFPAVTTNPLRKGSREIYARQEERGGWRTEIDEDLAARLADTNSFYLATATADGQPYIQHRGGPKGFVKILDKNTIAFADYGGNRQYITQGNLSENSKAYIFVMDYAHRRRVKIWGEARMIDDDPALMQSLMPKGYRARPEQVVVFRIAAWDTNCPQHIPQKFDAEDVAAALGARDERIAELEAELAALKGQPAPQVEA